MKIKWNRLAIKQFVDAIQYLEENDFFDYAIKIEKEILSKIETLPESILIIRLIG